MSVIAGIVGGALLIAAVIIFVVIQIIRHSS